jgi:hypothetical protein
MFRTRHSHASEIRYRVRNSLPLLLILCHINHILHIPSYLSKIHLNITHPLRLGFPGGLPLILDFPPLSYIQSSLPFALHVLPISYSYDLSTLIIFGKEGKSLLPSPQTPQSVFLP